MSKCIWYISKYASPLKYGFGTRHFYLAKEFNRLGRNTVIISSDSNHLVDIPRRDHTYFQEVIDGVETWWIRTIKYRGANSFRRILSWLDFEFKLWLMPKRELPQPDVVIVSSLSLLTVFNGYLLKRKYGCNLIFEVRDIWPLTLIEEGGFSKWNLLIRLLAWAERFGYQHADIVVGTMPNLTEHVTTVMGKPMNCVCIPFGYDPGLYANLEPLLEDYTDLFIPKEKFIVGYAGSIGLTNALEPLIDCAIAMKDDKRVHFLLLGSGDLLESFKTKVQGLSNITFAPKVGKAQVHGVLEHCQILYFSVKDSLVWRYGLSLNKLIDYMMAAKPIVASYNGYPSMINEAKCGRFIPANDIEALRQTIVEYAKMSPEQLHEIGQRGKDWLIRHRPYHKIAQDYCQLFH
ncbi:MAG: glycosyltransferase family 4 protein [Bacteroidia bacterium]|nr:glycosyltransferase family 4 protein [Bacteroidia bacterium]